MFYQELGSISDNLGLLVYYGRIYTYAKQNNKKHAAPLPSLRRSAGLRHLCSAQPTAHGAQPTAQAAGVVPFHDCGNAARVYVLPRKIGGCVVRWRLQQVPIIHRLHSRTSIQLAPFQWGVEVKRGWRWRGDEVCKENVMMID